MCILTFNTSGLDAISIIHNDELNNIRIFIIDELLLVNENSVARQEYQGRDIIAEIRRHKYVSCLFLVTQVAANDRILNELKIECDVDTVIPKSSITDENGDLFKRMYLELVVKDIDKWFNRSNS